MELQTKQVKKLVDPEDAALDGMNAIHLAAKFDPKSLQESLKKLKKLFLKPYLMQHFSTEKNIQ